MHVYGSGDGTIIDFYVLWGRQKTSFQTGKKKHKYQECSYSTDYVSHLKTHEKCSQSTRAKKAKESYM